MAWITKHNLQKATDEKVMCCVIEGDAEAFSIIYERYADSLWRYFYRMLGRNEEKANDFVQDFFMKIVEKPERYSPKKKFTTWMYSVANNMCKNEYRHLEVKQKSNEHIKYNAETNTTKQETMTTQLDYKQFKKMLDMELALLDQKHRSTFILRFQDELSIKEIAEVLSISEGTVKSRLFYTIKKLSEKLRIFDLN